MTQDYGIKIGSDVSSNSDLDLNFTSKYSSLKIYQWGDAQFTTNGSGDGSVNVNHDLNYAPIVIVYQKLTPTWSGGGESIPNGSANSFCRTGVANWYAGGVDNANIDVYTTTSDFTIEGSLIDVSTTYYFRYYILVDLSQAFSSASNISLTGDHGFKVSKEEKSVLTAEEYDMAYSSKYKALQYYSNHIVEETLTLPAMFASPIDTYVDEVAYVDFNHNYGYPPLYYIYAGDSPLNLLTSAPFTDFTGNNISYNVAGFCDSSKVRVYFWRASRNIAGTTDVVWATTTITIKCIMFSENLLGAASG